MMTQDDVLEVFRAAGALLDGHFLLASGYHSPTYLEKFLVLQYPRQVELLCGELAEPYRDLAVDVVLGPTTGGMLLAYEVAKRLGTRSLYAERADDGKGRELRRGFAIASGERVLVVDDILTTGGSVRETIKLVTDAGAELVGVGVLADRSGGSVDFGAPLHALVTMALEKYAPDAIPDWLAAIPLTERGTSRLLSPNSHP
jgi:orotate phosphoribosyltransferase